MQEEYMTVGQLARKVGTTVRTIQYYDQQGLLAPSAKGPSNIRLYSAEDEARLYRILTLKYLGLSLADIKERQGEMDSMANLHSLLLHTMEDLQEDFQNLVKRLSVLHALLDKTSVGGETSWGDLARTIEADNGEGSYFWHRMDEVTPDAVGADGDGRDGESVRERGLAVASWHELVADTIALMSEHVPPEDGRAREVARRYMELEKSQEGSLAESFSLAENVTPHHGAAGSFEVLRESVLQYLEEVKKFHFGVDVDVGV